MIDADPTLASRTAADSNEIDDLFEIFFTSPGRANKPIGMQGDIGWKPATDVYETEDEFVVQVDLAGMRRSDIEVYVDGDFILLKGTRKNIAPSGKKHYHKMEISVGPFERHVRIPAGVDATTTRAHYSAGFLFIRMARGEGRQSGRRSVRVQSR